MATGARQYSAQTGLSVARAGILIVAVALLVGAVLSAFSVDALAQEQKRRWFSLRELFAPRERSMPDRSYFPDAPEPAKPRKPKAAKKKAATTPREPEIIVKDKAPDARVILVVGDFVGGGLAEGLAAVYADNSGVTVIDRTRASSGLVRTDIQDWPKEIAALVAKEKPAVTIVQLGSNDRQPLKIDDVREPARSKSWTVEYEKRVAALAQAIGKTETPLLWFGLPSFKSAKMSEDILAFNEIYRAATTEVGGQFIDVWDGFVDENGAFVTTGPDINGQPVRLRNNDGINLTRAGKRKMAFYGEKQLAKILGVTSTPSVAALPSPTSTPQAEFPKDRTPPMSLDDPELDGGAELLGGTVPAQPTARINLVNAPKGRADDFNGAREMATPAKPVENEATAATR